MLLSDVIQVPIPPILLAMGLVPAPRVPKDSMCLCKRELSAEEAGWSCNDLGEARLLEELNKDRPSDKKLILKNGVSEAIRFLIDYDHDFGIASAFFRLINANTFPSGQLEQFFNTSLTRTLNFQRAAGEGRIIEDEVGQEVILDPYDVKPRRIWDLYSNRVIPFKWFELLSLSGHSQGQEASNAVALPGLLGGLVRGIAMTGNIEHTLRRIWDDTLLAVREKRPITRRDAREAFGLYSAAVSSVAMVVPDSRPTLATKACPDFWAISHSWVDPTSRESISSVVNQHEWQIPVPRGVILEDIRRDLRSFSAEYAWLDILCLRQLGSDPVRNRLAENEHRIDVPTIGNVYKQATKVLYYFNGLRQPLRTTGLQHSRHWLNRAWTLQEIVDPKYSFTMEAVTGEVMILWKSALVSPYA